jgi:hypothetical protein
MKYETYEIRLKESMQQMQYKCSANTISFGLHAGPESYLCSNYGGTPYPVCEKHALGEPYGKGPVFGSFKVTPMEFKTGTIPLEPIKPAPVCYLANGKWGNQGTDHGYGECDGPITEEINFYSGWHPVCQKHVVPYHNAGGGWQFRPLSGQPEIEYTKYDNSYNHQNTENNIWWCEDSAFPGTDGTSKHWGDCYQLENDLDYKFACDNHVQKHLNEGYTKLTSGKNGSQIDWSKNPPKQESRRVITKEKVLGGWPIRTQKAKGLVELKNASFLMPDFKIYDVQGIEPSTLLGHFIRPCPVRPRHGFVDSRKIDTVEQAEIIIKETLAADPDAEFVLMPYVNAEFSGIWTPGHLAVGLGTDGATAGKTAVTIPALGDALNTSSGSYSSSTIGSRAGIENAPYVELLWQKQYGELQTQFVQLRDGPKLPNQIDYIPTTIKIENIIVAKGDLLAWEKKMRANLPPGTVIDHTGGSLASHYAIHAVLNHIPILISRKPVLGETLEPTQDKETPMDIQALRAGFVIACDINMGEDMEGYKNAAYVMLAGCHHTTVWSGKYDLLLGMAMGCAWRLTVIASLGEGRHHDSNSRRRANKSRDRVYSKAWDKTDTQYTRLKFMQTINLFLNGDKWPGSNFGGKSWFKLTRNAVDMYNALVAKKPAEALEALNQLVHSAHNSGWGFNKFIEQRELDRTAKNPIYASLKIAPFLYQILTKNPDELKAAARTWWKRSAPELPKDEGTGGTLEDSSENDHDEVCECDDCTNLNSLNAKAQRLAKKMKIPHTVIEAQAKPHENGMNYVHIQWKAERMHGKQYFIKNVGSLTPEVLALLTGTLPSFTGPSGTMAYTKLQKSGDGWYIQKDGFDFHKLLNLEEIPNG